jgi:hypothetical protein
MCCLRGHLKVTKAQPLFASSSTSHLLYKGHWGARRPILCNSSLLLLLAVLEHSSPPPVMFRSYHATFLLRISS